MAWRTLITTLAMALGIAIPVAARAAGRPDASCIDAVVVAKIVRTTPTPLPQVTGPEGKAAIILRWPWHVELEVQQTLGARRSLPRDLVVTMSLHSGLNRDMDQAIFFLKRGAAGRYVVEDFEFQVLVEKAGRFALVIDPEELAERDWAPADSGAWLRDIRYQTDDARWANVWSEDPEPPTRTAPVSNEKGVLANDIPAMLRAAGRGFCT